MNYELSTLSVRKTNYILDWSVHSSGGGVAAVGSVDEALGVADTVDIKGRCMTIHCGY